jgi:DNA-binding MarR family transcriptional regulator
MKLETKIQQSKFRNEYHKLAVNIFYTHSWLLNRQSDLFQKFAVSGSQYNMLRILRGQNPKPASINLLRERMVDKMSDASRLVERLRLKGLVQREFAPKDRRRVNVSITEKGLKLLYEIDQLDHEYDSFFHQLNEEEAEKVNNLLDKLRG